MFANVDTRIRRAVRSTLWHAGARLLTVACALAQVPSALRQLGLEGYGFVITAMAASSLAGALCDAGVGLAVQTRLAANSEPAQASLRRTIFWRGTAMCATMAAGWFLLGAVLIHFGSWRAWLGLSNATAIALPPSRMLLWSWAFACASLPVGITTRLCLAEQRNWINGAAACVASVVLLAAVLACEWIGAAPAITAVCLLSAPALPAVLAAAIVWPGRHVEAVAPAPARLTLLKEGLHFFPSQIAAFWWISVTPVALGLLVNAQAVAQFNLVQRLFSLLHQVQIFVLQPFWPTLTEAHSRKDHAWLRQCYRGLSLGGGVAFAVAAGLLAFGIHPFLSLWLGTQAPPFDCFLLVACAAWNVVWLLAQPPTFLLTALAQTSTLTCYGITGLACSAGAIVLAAPRAGAAGVVGALAFVYGGIVLPGLARAARKILPAS